MKKTLLAIAMLSLVASSAARAEDPKPDNPKPDNETSFNLAATSDYRFRGISQTRLQPALQGGADYTNNPTGLYAGTWLSTIKWTRDAGGSGDIEWDIYGGKRGEIAPGIAYDVGVLTYVYAGNGLAHVARFANANTTEVYGQLGVGPATLKYSHAVTNLFAFVNSKNSGYLDLSANFDMQPGLVLNTHVGHQNVEHNGAASYTDWRLGVTKDFGIVSAALAVVGTDASESAYASPANGKFLGKRALVLTLTKTF